MKKPLIKITVIKTFCILVIFSVLNLITQNITPIFTNEIALQQMNNDAFSSSGIGIISYISNFTWIVAAILLYLFFKKELFYFIKKFKEKNNNEKF